MQKRTGSRQIRESRKGPSISSAVGPNSSAKSLVVVKPPRKPYLGWLVWSTFKSIVMLFEGTSCLVQCAYGRTSSHKPHCISSTLKTVKQQFRSMASG